MVRLLSKHLVSAGRASISILIIIVVGVIIVLKFLERRRGRLYKATKVSLLSSNMADTGVHLIHLSNKCIKMSIHVRIKSHNSRRRKGSEGGWS